MSESQKEKTAAWARSRLQYGTNSQGFSNIIRQKTFCQNPSSARFDNQTIPTKKTIMVR
jgi:hypothetical protein